MQRRNTEYQIRLTRMSWKYLVEGRLAHYINSVKVKAEPLITNWQHGLLGIQTQQCVSSQINRLTNINLTSDGEIPWDFGWHQLYFSSRSSCKTILNIRCLGGGEHCVSQTLSRWSGPKPGSVSSALPWRDQVKRTKKCIEKKTERIDTHVRFTMQGCSNDSDQVSTNFCRIVYIVSNNSKTIKIW